MKQRILLVDDDENILKIWEHFLEPLDVEILLAHNVAEAIEQMRKVPPPDFVFLDLHLPPHAPTETIAEIKTLREFNPKLVVLAISGLSQDEILHLVSKARVDASVSKYEAQTQIDLLRAMKTALSNGANGGKLLANVSDIIYGLQHQ